MFNGSMVALVTPMQADGSVDKASLHDLIEWHIASKTDAIVVNGTTGEGSTLSEAEHFDILSTVVAQVDNRIPVIAGTGCNGTAQTIRLTENAFRARANAALIVTPYYNKPTQAGLIAHYKAITDNVILPVILYNVPSRTACDILPETVEQLAKIPTVIGIKEATGKLDRAKEIMQRCGNNFYVYSGDDETACDLMLSGGKGVISVTANIAPKAMRDLCDAALAGNKQLAHQLNDELMPLHKGLFVQSNPIPVKWALHTMGRIPPGIRLPLLPLDTAYQSELKNTLIKTGVLREKTLT